MDVSKQLADYAAAQTGDVLERATPVEIDAGLLAAYDTTPVDASEYESNREEHLLSLTLTSTQSLIASMFALPVQKDAEHGPIAQLPEPVFQLPREKPLPKPKPLTKWERFANAKGISHVKKDRKVWDEERQDWVNRWGKDGKNKDAEDQWLHELKPGQDSTVDPRATAKKERKDRMAKNDRQHARNVADAAAAAANPVSVLDRNPLSTNASQTEKKTARTARKAELERSMLVSKTSTASLGRFDRKIEGEPKAKGIKRKFEANVGDYADEKATAMNLLNKLGTAERKKQPKKGGEGREGDLNLRKAVRHETRKKQLENTRRKK